MSKLLIGTDPEFFLKDKKGNFVSAHDKVPGDKHNPFKVPGGAVQVDGLAVEFNIEPASSGDEFADKHHTVLKELRKLVDPRLKFDFSPVVRIPKDYFAKVPDKAKELGCDPDMNVYLKGFNKIPENVPMRTGSGHLHLGWTKDEDIKDTIHQEDCEAMVMALDQLFQTCEADPGFSATGGFRWCWDRDVTRQTMYGKRGSYRVKPYGVEYRVLSNAWLNYPKMWPWLFEVVKSQYDNMKDSGYFYYGYSFDGSSIQKATNINSHSVNLWKTRKLSSDAFDSKLEM